MSFSFLKRLFGAEAQEGGQLPPIVEDVPPVPADDTPDTPPAKAVNFEALQKFVRYLVCNLVDHPEEVSLSTAEKGDLTIIQIHCVKKDIGKIIGKSGKTISALRTLVLNAASHARQRVTVDVMDE